jgi:hypothetical protein
MRLLVFVSAIIASGFAAAPAFAEQIAIDPPPDPQPYSDPVAEPEAPHESTVLYGAVSQMSISGDAGLEPAGFGGTVGFTWLQRHGDQPTGFDVAGTFLTGEDVSIYDLSLRLIASPKIGRHAILPYVALGFCAGASRLVTDRDRSSMKDVHYGLGIGPSASAGLHGFMGKFYWRAGAGFLGAGVGAVTADLTVGMVMD